MDSQSIDMQIFDTRQCELGEGVFWHPERKQLFWFDILAGKLLSQCDGKAQEWTFGECASACGWVDTHTLIVATETGLRRFDIDSGQHEPLVSLEPDNPHTRSNDGRADPNGGFWIGTMGKRCEPEAGALYRYHRGAVFRLRDRMTIPNSICFSPDGRKAYFTDTPTRIIHTQALDSDGWPDGAAEVFVDLSDTPGAPDGSVIDADGYLWNAQWGAGRVARYDPNGRYVDHIDLAGSQVSCPAFGGETFSSLFCSTAWERMTDPGPSDGCLYRASLGPDIKGRPEPRVIL